MSSKVAEVGSNAKATVVIEFAPGLHGYQNPPTKDYMIPVAIKSIEGATFVSAQYPDGTVEMVAGEMAAVYSDRIEIPVVLKLPDKDGQNKISVVVSYQQCNESICFAPSTVVASAEVTLVANKKVESAKKVEPPIKAPEQTQPIVKQAAPKIEPESVSKPAIVETTGPGDDGLLGWLTNALDKEDWSAIVPLALLVGLALCLTPCVFPMIPVTVSFFSSQATEKKSARAAMGATYALGIAVTYGAVGGVSAALGGAVGALFTKPWFAFALSLLLVALALSMFDLYEIRLPGFLQKQLKGRSGLVGALIMGLLMGFAAAPCAGAVVGAVAVKVAELGSVPLGIGMFGLVGLGMGLPFMVLASLSSGAKKLPRSGGWLKTVKAVLGLVVLAIAAQYLFQGLGFKADSAKTIIAWAIVYTSFGIFLLVERSEPSRPVLIIKGIAIGVLGYLMGMAISESNQIRFREQFEAQAVGSEGSQVSIAGIKWVPYNEQSFAEAVASGKPIMIDGKADWCLQCREIEHNVFNTPEGLAALTGVYLMSIDWSTGVDQKFIDATQKRFNIVGLPHIVFMQPGGGGEFAVKDLKSVEDLKAQLRKAGAKI